MSARVITLHSNERDEITGKRYWLVGYRNAVMRVSTPNRYNRKHAIKVMRYAICKATKLNASDFRFVGNQVSRGRWYSIWYVTNERQR